MYWERRDSSSPVGCHGSSRSNETEARIRLLTTNCPLWIHELEEFEYPLKRFTKECRRRSIEERRNRPGTRSPNFTSTMSPTTSSSDRTFFFSPLRMAKACYSNRHSLSFASHLRSAYLWNPEISRSSHIVLSEWQRLTCSWMNP